MFNNKHNLSYNQLFLLRRITNQYGVPEPCVGDMATQLQGKSTSYNPKRPLINTVTQ